MTDLDWRAAMTVATLEQEIRKRWGEAEAAINTRRDELYKDAMSRAFNALLQGDEAGRTRILGQTREIDRQADNAKREAIARISMELGGMDEDKARAMAAKLMARPN